MAVRQRRVREFTTRHGWVVAVLAALAVRQMRFADRVNLVDFDSRFDAALAIRGLERQSYVLGLRNEYLTGLGNLQWGNVRWLDPVSIAGVLGPGAYSMAAAAIVSLLCVFASVRSLARAFDVSVMTANAAGLLAAAMAVGPGVVPVILPDQFRIVPSFPIIASAAALVLGSFERVGASTGRVRVAHGAAVVVASTYLVVVHTHYLVLPAFVCVVGVSAVVAHRLLVGARVRAQLALVGGLLVLWWMSGVAAYVRGFLSYVAAVEFGERFSWSFAPFGRLATLTIRTWFPQASSESLRWLAAAGLAVGPASGVSRLRARHGRLVVVTAAVLVAIVGYRISQRWWPYELGPTSDYLAWMAIPTTATLIAVGLAAATQSLRRRGAIATRSPAIGLVLGGLICGAVVISSPRLDPPADTLPTPAATGWATIVETTSLDGVATFRGRSVVMAWTEEVGGLTLGRAAPFDWTLRWGVPVLNEHSHLQTPASFEFFSRFLFRSEDGQIRNHPGLRRIDERILQLVGVRYLVTDWRGSLGSYRHVKGSPLVETPYGRLPLLESAVYNDGCLSPVSVVISHSLAETYRRMADPDLDLATHVLTDDLSLAEARLVPARGVVLSYDAGDLHVVAESDGESLLVLPLEYSTCLRVRPRRGQVPSVYRVDAVLTGIRFSGRLDADLEFRFGPGPWATCRLRDLADFRAARS